MAAESKIEWTETTWNSLTGCTKISAGCQHCYAERMAKRLQAMGVERYRNAFQLTELSPPPSLTGQWLNQSWRYRSITRSCGAEAPGFIRGEEAPRIVFLTERERITEGTRIGVRQGFGVR
jgi:hypothetical protein